MIQLERHIEILLLWNDCVIVPGLGGFTASHVPARFDEADNMFIPPLRTLGFNHKLNVNDSLLAQSYTEAYDISYPEALKRIEGEVVELRQHIENEGQYVLNDIGTLYLTENGSIGFTPCEAGVLTPALYSLSSFDMQKLSHANNVYNAGNTQKQDYTPAHITVETKPAETTGSASAETSEAASDGDDSTISIRLSVLRNVAAILIAVAGFFMLSTPVNNSQSTMKMSQIDGGIVSKLISSYSNEEAKAAALPYPAKNAKAVNATEKGTESANAEITSRTQNDYFCLVLASRVTKKNAQAFVDRLANEGYKDVRVLTEEGRSTKVVYGTFSTQSAAYNALNSLNEKEAFREAWVYEVKP